MTSIRHNTELERTPRDGYLDAARACILDVGWRRTTLTEVARRAGVSRMTIYRTWSDMRQLMGDLMTREWSVMVGAALSEGGSEDSAQRLVDGIVATVRSMRENELFERIVDLDPELILPYVFSRRGRSQDLVLAAIEDAVRRGQKARQIRRGNPTAIARSLVLAAHGFALSAQTMIDDDVSLEQLDAELAHLLLGSVQP